MKKIMIAAILLMVNFFAHAENKFIESGEKKTISLVSKDTKLMEMLKINPANKNTWKILEGGKETPGFNVVFDTEKQYTSVPNTDTLTTIYDFIERTEQKLSGKIIIKQVRTSFFELFANATSMENGVIPEEKKYYQASTQWVVEVITSQGETITLSEKIEDMSIFIMSEDYKLETSMNHEYVFIYNYNKDNIYRIIAGNPELWPVWSEKIIEPIVTETTTDRMSVEMFLSGRTQKNIEFFPDSVIIKQTNLHMNNGLKVSTVSITGYLDIGNYKMEPMFIVSIERTEGIKSVKIIDFWTSTGDNPANFNLHTLKIQEVYEFKINRMSGGSSYALLYEDGLREDENSVSQNPISNEVAELLLGWMREKK